MTSNADKVIQQLLQDGGGMAGIGIPLVESVPTGAPLHSTVTVLVLPGSRRDLHRRINEVVAGMCEEDGIFEEIRQKNNFTQQQKA